MSDLISTLVGMWMASIFIAILLGTAIHGVLCDIRDELRKRNL